MPAAGDRARAARAYAEAIALARRFELNYEVAELLLAQAALGGPRAAAARAEALALARRLGGRGLAERARHGSDAGHQPAGGAALTLRELEVLRLLAAGRASREIAAALVVSVRTVESRLAHLYGKLGVRSRAEAVAYAHSHALT